MAESPLKLPPEVMQVHKIIPQAKIPASLLTPLLTNGKSSLPITPEKETIQQVLQIFKRHQQGLWEDRDLILLPLRPSSYNKLREQLEADDSLREYVDDDIRLEYDPVSELLTIKMPSSPAHEAVTWTIIASVFTQLQKLGTGDGPVATYAREILNLNTARIWLTHGELVFEKSPDSQFIHSEAFFPGVIFETSYSQDKKNLKRLAKTYILGSNGDIRVVVGIDMEYPDISSASVSLWQVKYTKEPDTTMRTVEVDSIIEDQVISDSINQDFKLVITLDKFGPEELALDLKKTAIEKVTITMTDLARAVQRARAGRSRESLALAVQQARAGRFRESLRPAIRTISEVNHTPGFPLEHEKVSESDDSNSEAESGRENREMDKDPDYEDPSPKRSSESSEGKPHPSKRRGRN
ncbi:MAG: hypothetical protein Q9187_004157 [Circinaria calcarea]